jgi:hypothetical protein
MSSRPGTAEHTGFVVTRRLGTAPNRRDSCTNATSCPDVFELASGDFAVIGEDVSADLPLPADAGRSETERTVLVPRGVFLAAVCDLAADGHSDGV